MTYFKLFFEMENDYANAVSFPYRPHQLSPLTLRTRSRPAVGSCSRELWTSVCSPTIASWGCGGWNVCSCCVICCSRTSGPQDAATNPRNGGEGLSGRVQNSGCACRPTKKG